MGDADWPPGVGAPPRVPAVARETAIVHEANPAGFFLYVLYRPGAKFFAVAALGQLKPVRLEAGECRIEIAVAQAALLDLLAQSQGSVTTG